MINPLIFILLLLLVTAFTGCGADRAQTPPPGDAAADAVKTFPARVMRVVDGDTLRVRLENGKEEKVRFIGVDTPENTREAEPFGKEAATHTQERLEGKTVYLELDVDERDDYGRILAYIWLSPPESGSEAEARTKLFNAELLLSGYARLMTVPPNVRYAELFVKLQREARQAGQGLWGACPGCAASALGQGASPCDGRRCGQKLLEDAAKLEPWKQIKIPHEKHKYPNPLPSLTRNAHTILS